MTDGEIKDIKCLVGKNVEYARNGNGWRQVQLAEKSGLNRVAVAKIESGDAVTIANLSRLADALQIPIFLLFLQKSDWKKFIKIFECGTDAQNLVEKAGSISREDIERIETKSLSDIPSVNKEAVLETNRLVHKVFGIEDEPVKDSSSFEISTKSATGIATKGIPGEPLLNGIIARLVSQ